MTRQILLDVSALDGRDAGTTASRMARGLVRALIHRPPAGHRVEPVTLAPSGVNLEYHYAGAWTSRALALPEPCASDDPIDAAPGDVLLVLGAAESVVRAEREGLHRALRDDGIALHAVVHDLVDGPWLEAVARFADRALAPSRTAAASLEARLRAAAPSRPRPLRAGWFRPGCDLERTWPSPGLPDGADALLARLSATCTFLMVEPAPGHRDILEAFAQLQAQGHDVTLAVVGHDAPEALPASGSLWLGAVSGEYLDRLYAASTCLIASSPGDGSALTLLEAAHRGLPIVARDLPLFREVAGPHAEYFAADPGGFLADWLARRAGRRIVGSAGMPRLTWDRSAEELAHQLILSAR